jgi:16S rRNA (uracil1498-N3)-methyltransferase
LEVLQLDQEPARVIEITLFQAMLKPKRMDWLVEKVTELGVQRIQPTVTERVISRFSSAEAARKREKWQRTTIEALKQCGGAWLPSVQMPDTISHLLAQPGSPSTHVVASLTSGAGRVRDQLRTLPGRGLQQTPMTIGVWIGPEGDFTHEEAETLKNAGALPVTLGSNVLRGETAAICAISLVGHELDCLREPA